MNEKFSKLGFYPADILLLQRFFIRTNNDIVNIVKCFFLLGSS